jgi:NADH/NAD ratio-sensing transcriptional regulator Rex
MFHFSGLVCLFLVPLFLTPILKAATGSGDSREISQLISRAQRGISEVRRDTSEMEQFGRSRIGWEAHTLKLTEIKEVVNQMAGTLQRLNVIRDTGSSSQQQAIGRLQFTLKEFAASIESTIQHLNMNHQDISTCVAMDPEYRKLLRSNSESAARLAEFAE